MSTNSKATSRKPTIVRIDEALGYIPGNILVISEMAEATVWPTLSLEDRKAIKARHDARPLPSIPVDPERLEHERDLAEALLMAKTDEAHEAAAEAVSRYFGVCMACVGDALSLYQDDLADGATIEHAVDTFLETLDKLSDDPISHGEGCDTAVTDAA